MHIITAIAIMHYNDVHNEYFKSSSNSQPVRAHRTCMGVQRCCNCNVQAFRLSREHCRRLVLGIISFQFTSLFLRLHYKFHLGIRDTRKKHVVYQT